MTVAGRLPLTRPRIIAAAVDLVDAHGVDALSMRKLGAALGVEAMSLYNHVANKDDVLDGVLDAVLREVALPDPALPWDEQLRLLAHAFRAAGLAHPGVLPMFGSRAIRTVEGFVPIERSFAVLRRAGLDPEGAFDAFLAIASFVLGFVMVEMGSLQAVAEGRTLDFATLSAAAHPDLVELGAALSAADHERQFTGGLAVVLDGLRQLVARQ